MGSIRHARSWIESANHPETDFPIENLPFGVFRAGDSTGHIGIAIGEQILDLHAAASTDLLSTVDDEIVHSCRQSTLNDLMSLGREALSILRPVLTTLLSDPSARVRVEPLLIPQSTAQMLLPARIGGYTDFYASIHHATNVGKLFRPDNPLLPNYKYVPIGYHGRASSIVVSGTEIRSPSGQIKSPDAVAPIFAPTRSLDYELEAAFFIGSGNALGEPIPIAAAESHIFGVCLLNDWSARDIQAWEYQPLGPFLGKNFATTISPWIVTMDALDPFRVPAFTRPEGDPQPLPYLEDRNAGGIDLILEVFLRTERMRRENSTPVRISRGNLRNLYWTLAQMLAHHASNGCNLQPGDLLATGTVSGPSQDSLGSLLEITRRGAEPLQLPNGESRKFLEDGDEVIFRGYCQRNGHARIGFGECRGIVRSTRPISAMGY